MIDGEKRIKLMQLIASKPELLQGINISIPKLFMLADHLISNGVTFATDTNVGSKWISVEDEKPNIKKVIDGEIYYRNVVVLTDDPMVPEKIAYYDEDVKKWFQPMDFIPLTNATHWMPLPTQPKRNDDTNNTMR